MKSLPTAALLGLVCTLTATPAIAATAVAATPDGDAQVTFSSHQLATSAGGVAVIDKIVETARRACVEPGFRPDTTTTSCTRDVATAMIAQAGEARLAILWRPDRSGALAARNLQSQKFAVK